jgi:aspartate-semialdehyde dehydrogenase
MSVFKIAIVGASTLLGKELKEVLEESPLAASDIILFDAPESQGQLDQIGEEATFLQAIDADAFEHMDFTFFCGDAELTRKHWRDALRSGSTVLDLSGALDAEPGVLVLSPWIGAEAVAPDLFTPAIIPAHPAALALALVIERLRLAAPVRSAYATLLLPASEFGRAAMDELHHQTVNLLSFQGMPRTIYDAQAAYNMLCGMGESATVSLNAIAERIRLHYASMASKDWPALALQVIHAPVFHGNTFSVAVELEQPTSIAVLEEALSGEHLDLVLEDTDSPSNLAATGQNDVLVRLRPEKGSCASGQCTRLWFWAACDNLRMYAQNAADCALHLRRMRPAGPVQ